VNPHLGHLYGLPNLRHLPSRLIWISPQFGHRNFVASPAGGIGFPQLVHVTKTMDDDFSMELNLLLSGKVKHSTP
jgi:hypothetical protein